MSRRGWLAAFALLLSVAGCGDDGPAEMVVMDLSIGPRAPTCRSKGTSQTCAVGEFCVTFEGGGLRCEELPAACLARATCDCMPPRPNGTCGCMDDGAGRIVVDCH